MRQAFGESMGYMGRAGIAWAGPPLCLYAENFDPATGGGVQVCAPVAPGIAGEGAVEAAVLPAGRCAKCI